MSKFYKTDLSHDVLQDDKTVVTINKSLKLIENSEFYEQLIALFKIDKESTDIIPFAGLNLLINSIIRKDEEFKKFDYKVNLSDVSLKDYTREGAAVLNIIVKAKQTGGDKDILLNAATVYNSKSDFYEGAYKLNSFAKFCYEENHLTLLKQNIEHLNEYYQNSNDFNRSFRFLKDSEGTYVRAITSTGHYNNYDNRFSVFVAIMALKNLMKSKNLDFKINRAEYDESAISVFFEKTGLINIPELGHVKFIIEMSNDEIKRGAMKFSAVFSIIVREEEIYLKPQRLKTELISIGHNFTPDTVFDYLSGLSEYIEKAEIEVVNNVKEFAKIKGADELRHLLLRKVETTKNDEIKENKMTIRRLLENRITTISELLVLMNKVDLIVSNLETKEYLRYLFYDILKGKK